MKTLTRVRLRELKRADIGRVVELTRATGVFRDAEIDIAEEVLCDALSPQSNQDPNPPYYTLGAELEGRVVGWICWGSTPCTEGTWDLYWLAVDPRVHGQGVGTALVEEMERRLAGRARLIVIDTSGRADYGPTRAFYAARAYREVAVVPDFYADGDDQIIFAKRLAPTPRPSRVPRRRP
jgi:ribosomal protein S18 acetylase RimI-like enzyme